MAKGKLFEYAIIYHPRKKEKDEEAKKSVLVKAPTTVLAGSDQEVGIVAAREVPADYLDRLEDVEIVIRPF